MSRDMRDLSPGTYVMNPDTFIRFSFAETACKQAVFVFPGSGENATVSQVFVTGSVLGRPGARRDISRRGAKSCWALSRGRVAAGGWGQAAASSAGRTFARACCSGLPSLPARRRISSASSTARFARWICARLSAASAGAAILMRIKPWLSRVRSCGLRAVCDNPA